jgi:predicted esterase
LPFIAIPTTYSGSEQTSLYGTTKDGKKTTGRDPRVRPLHVIYDGSLTADTPKALTVTSLMNALAHPIGTLGTGKASAELHEQALKAIALVYGALESLLQDPLNPRARAQAQQGAALAAQVLEGASLGTHHALAHRVGGAFDVEHGALHSVLLPHSVHRLRAEAPTALAEIEAQLQVTDLEAKLFDLLAQAGAATSLKALGVTWAKLEGWLETVPETERALLRSAFHGRRPSMGMRLVDWGLPEPVSLSGPPFGEARRIVVAIHGRGATAESVSGRVLEIVGHDPHVAVVAPQGRDNIWYPGRYSASRAEHGLALTNALEQVATVLDRVISKSDKDRVVVFGFSQGACLALEAFIQRGEPLPAIVALSGAFIGPDEELPTLPQTLAGTPVLLGGAVADPYVDASSVEHTARMLGSAGCTVTLEMVPGNVHTVHPSQRPLAKALLLGPK